MLRSSRLPSERSGVQLKVSLGMLQGHFYSGEKLIWIPGHKGISGDEAAAGALLLSITL